MPATYGVVDAGSPVADHPLNRGLVAWWLPLPDQWGGLTLRDLCPRGLHATLTNFAAPFTSTSGWVTCPNGLPALAHDGTNDYADPGSPAALSLTTWTVEAYVRPRSLSAYQSVLAQHPNGTTDQRNFNLATNNTGKARVYFTQGTGSYKGVDGATTLTAGRWYHLAGTYVSGSLKLFVNGVQDASSTSYTGNPDNPGPVKIGSLWGSGEPWPGEIAHVRIHDCALTSPEIAALYDQALCGHPDTLRRITRPPVAPAVAAATGNRRRRVLIGCGG